MEEGGGKVGQIHVIMENEAGEIGEVRRIQPTIAGFEDERRGQEPRQRWPLEAGNGSQFAASKATGSWPHSCKELPQRARAWKQVLPSTCREVLSRQPA